MTDTSPDVALPEEYAELSRRYAHDGDLRMAQLAAWAGDVHVLEGLLWENGLEQAPDPLAQLAAVGESVALAIEDFAMDLPDEPLTARAVVETAREALVTTFDESVHGLLLDRFAGLGQLDDAQLDDAEPDDAQPDDAQLDDAQPDDAQPDEERGGGPGREERLAARLAGRSADALATDLRTAAADCATMAGLLAADGEPEAAGRLSRQADTAAFEAHLVATAVRAGDDTLATVDLRWELAGRADDRHRLLGVLGSAERDALARTFEPHPEPHPGPAS